MMRIRIALLALPFVVIACGDAPTQPGDPARDAGSWATWVLPASDALRPPAPPADDSPAAVAERDEIVRLQTSRTPEVDALLRRWDSLPTTPWHNTALDVYRVYWATLPDERTATPARSTRGMALLHVAMYDALVAAWDAKYAYERRAPAAADARVKWLGSPAGVPSYPSEHAAAAEAAAIVLSYLFPREDTLAFHRMAADAGESRIVAGAAYRSDVEAGQQIGRAVGQAVVAWARLDGADSPWTGGQPVGEDLWQPTPPRMSTPFDPGAGSWRTWVLPWGSAFRPEPPPSVQSARFTTDLNELRQLSTSRTVAQADLARYWATDAPSSRWEVFIQSEIEHRRFDTMHAARALALSSIAMADAMVACWEGKFYYWYERPISADPSLDLVFSTPPFPSYPSGHSTQSAAAAEVFAELFPDRAGMYRALADSASLSRVYGGIHFRFDIEAGEELGRKIGRAVVERARADGAH